MMKKFLSNKGVSLLEVLASMGILAIVAMSLVGSTITAFKNHKSVQINGTMQIMAQDQIEKYAAINPQAMTSVSHDLTENNITASGLSANVTFNRVTNVTQNADDSRTIQVTVNCNHPMFSKSITKQTTFTRW